MEGGGGGNYGGNIEEGHVTKEMQREILVGKPEGKRPLGKPRRRWEDNIKIDLQEVEYVCMD